jgi:hypothetical protein
MVLIYGSTLGMVYYESKSPNIGIEPTKLEPAIKLTDHYLGTHQMEWGFTELFTLLHEPLSTINHPLLSGNFT